MKNVFFQIAKDISRDEEAFDYDDYAPEAAALMKVEILELEEKTGPSLGRVLGKLSRIISTFHQDALYFFISF